MKLHAKVLLGLLGSVAAIGTVGVSAVTLSSCFDGILVIPVRTGDSTLTDNQADNLAKAISEYAEVKGYYAASVYDNGKVLTIGLYKEAPKDGEIAMERCEFYDFAKKDDKTYTITPRLVIRDADSESKRDPKSEETYVGSEITSVVYFDLLNGAKMPPLPNKFVDKAPATDAGDGAGTEDNDEGNADE